jgi:hypothetical protein
MSLSGRIGKLEGVHAVPSCVDWDSCYPLFHVEGEPVPPIPAYARPCPRCGEMHVRIITMVVVNTREEAEAVLRRRETA